MAKTLIIMRHAKSSWKDKSLQDWQRPLNKRGVKAAATMAYRFRQKCIEIDKILVSPALRARSTAAIFIENQIDLNVRLTIEPQLYGNSMQTLLELIHNTDTKLSTLMLIGHDPECHELIEYFEAQGSIEHVPTAAMATFVFDTKQWNTLAPQNASLLDFDYPKKFLEE